LLKNEKSRVGFERAKNEDYKSFFAKKLEKYILAREIQGKLCRDKGF
jgi:hypothetical protein